MTSTTTVIAAVGAVGRGFVHHGLMHRGIEDVAERIDPGEALPNEGAEQQIGDGLDTLDTLLHRGIAAVEHREQARR